MTTYYKVTNEEECHHGFQYKDGLNVLVEPFNYDPKQSCCEGGLYFTTKEHIHKFYEFGIYIREVFLPTDNKDFKMVQDPEGDKWRANMLIFGKKYDMTNFDHIKYILENINNYTEKFIDCASANGYVDVLEWFKNSGYELKYTFRSINFASKNGHVDVLEWFKNSGYEFKYTSYAVNWASKYGHINVLEWFKIYGYV